MRSGFFIRAAKVLLSGVLAIVILTLACLVYYNVPIHHKNNDGSTDYKWEPGVFYSRMTEGFAWGRINNDGFKNTFDYTPGMDIDVLIMGSSHMAAFQVAADRSCAARLGEMLEGSTVYNIGVAAHTFLVCASNLDAALERYSPSGFVVMETDNIIFSDRALKETIEGSRPRLKSYSGGLIGLLQRNQYFRLVYGQITNYLKKETGDAEDGAQVTAAEGDNNEELLSALLEKLAASADRNGIRLIILYHPDMRVREDGSLLFNRSESAVSQFARLCETNGIIFLDMTDRFESEYRTSFTLPCGFANSPVSTGHLNEAGHFMAAQELKKIIQEVE